MSGIEEVPSNSRAMGYDASTGKWVNQAVTASGEVKIMQGATLVQFGTVRATAASGGTVLASGPVSRVVLRVPEIYQSGPAGRYSLFYTNSGLPVGIMLGGCSGNSPCLPDILSALAFDLRSGRGLWLPPGSQKELYVNNLYEVKVLGEPSGYPVTWVGERF